MLPNSARTQPDNPVSDYYITCPTLLITSNQWTDEEGVHQLQFYKDNAKHSQHIVIDVDNHRIHELRPDEFFDAVESFLKPLNSE